MRGNVKVIKFTTFMSILFLTLTYFTTVNIESNSGIVNDLLLTWEIDKEQPLEEYDVNYQTKHKPCDFLQEDGNCKLGDCKPDSCKKISIY